MTPLIRYREFCRTAAAEAGMNTAEFTAALAQLLEPPDAELMTPEARCMAEFEVAPLRVLRRAYDLMRASRRVMAAAS